jgi:hypothetical protein
MNLVIFTWWNWLTFNERGLIVMDNELFYDYLLKQGYFQVKYKFIKPFIC